MSVTITLAPSSPKRLAIAAPKPEPPPIENDVLDGSWLSCGGGLLTGDDGNFALESCALGHCVWLLRSLEVNWRLSEIPREMVSLKMFKGLPKRGFR